MFGVGPQIGYVIPMGDLGIRQPQGLRGIRREEPARWLEYLGHIRDFAGGGHAERTAAKGDADEIARPIPGSGSGQKTVVPST